MGIAIVVAGSLTNAQSPGFTDTHTHTHWRSRTSVLEIEKFAQIFSRAAILTPTRLSPVRNKLDTSPGTPQFSIPTFHSTPLTFPKPQCHVLVKFMLS